MHNLIESNMQQGGYGDVNLNALAGILGNSKKVMEMTDRTMTEGTSATHGGYDASEEKPLPNLIEEKYNTMPSVNTGDVGSYSDDAVLNSNLPDNVKKAMLENRIDVAPPSAQIPESLRKKKPQMVQETQKQPMQRQTSGVSREELKSVIQEVLSEMMMGQISEAVIKQTLKKMVTEGKIKVKK
jgi:hypothetical protein